MAAKKHEKPNPKPIGKKLSGWENELRRRERNAKKLAAAEAQTGERAALLERIGEFPVDDPETAMGWYRRAQGILLGELMKDPTVEVREIFAAVKQMSEAAGKTRDQSALEERVATLEASVQGTRAKGAVEVKSTHGVTRPPTARGGSRARRPRAVEEPPPRPDGT